MKTRLLALFLALAAGVLHAEIDLSRAVVVAPPSLNAQEKEAVQVLLDEVFARTKIRLPVGSSPTASFQSITVARVFSGPRPIDPNTGKPVPEVPPPPPEGYLISTRVIGKTTAIQVYGNDSRGVLFGVGRLLRSLTMSPGSLSLSSELNVTSAPKIPLRGHQLGFRPKTNSYDAWTVAMWKQYIRDLAVFGTNAIELIPPRSDDDDDSPHFPLPKIDMMVEMSRLCDELGLDVWIWYPALDNDYSDPATVEFALKEWAEVFSKLPRIDHVFVPGGDPGHTQPKYLMALLEKQTANLRKYHANAKMWVAPQGFSNEWLNEFYAIVRKQPDWLEGIVFGPQIRIGLPELRRNIPAKYPIRRYPDITHSRHSQYPVPDWDLAYALTEAREVINPRPLDQANIFHRFEDQAIGYLTYSEGCNDDVNKIVWSGLGWNPETPVVDVLREFSRYFIGERYTESFTQALLALERNWRGPLISNEGVYTTLRQVQSMERSASPADLLNWRFQQVQYRAYYDAYNRSRLIYETALEEQALAALRSAPVLGSSVASDQARLILNRAVTEPISADWRARIFELAEALYQSIRMQLSVERYKAISVGRGANLDTVDHPLNNRLWLTSQLEEIGQLSSEEQRLAAIDSIVNWDNPGPGGFYDDLGNLSRQPHLVRGEGYSKDPAHLESSLVSFAVGRGYLRYPTQWWRHAEGLNDAPLKMHYDGLNPAENYRLKVVYGGDNPQPRIRLLAGDRIEIHGLINRPVPFKPLEFDIPREATSDGKLDLTWYRESGLGGNGRGNAVAEVWLMLKPETAGGVR